MSWLAASPCVHPSGDISHSLPAPTGQVVLRQMQLVVIEQGWLRVTECKASALAPSARKFLLGFIRDRRLTRPISLCAAARAEVAKLCQRVMECVIWYLDAKITAGRGDTPPSLRATMYVLN